MFFARYAAKLAICCPFALLCYLPLSGFLRLPLKKLAAFGALGVTAFVGIGALAAAFSFPSTRCCSPPCCSSCCSI